MRSTKGVKLSTWRATTLHSVDIILIKHIWYSYTNHLGLFENYMVCVCWSRVGTKLFRAVAL